MKTRPGVTEEGRTVAIVEPTAASARRLGDAVDAGFSAADLAWESCMERAALACRAGDVATAARLWEQGLAIARKHFGRGDPRLASSLTNQALVMRRRRYEFQA